MKTIILLLPLLGGLCSALQPGLEYHYRYSGRVASGITDSKHQYAAAGIQADVTVQVAEDHSAIVQFSHVEVGNFHDELHCDDVREALPIEYHRLEQHNVELLEKPFRVRVDESQVIDFLEVPEEPVWITNIRKAIVNIFRIHPFKSQHHAGEAESPVHHLDFSSSEETIFGRCTNWYSIVELPEADAAIYERFHELEVDAQREGGAASGSYTGAKTSGGAKGRKGAAKGRKTSSKTRSKTSKTSPSRYTSGSGSIDDTLWKVTRTVDFEQCEYLVSMKGHLTPHTEDLFSRSSVSSYIIRGNAESMRIERVVVEGTISFFTNEDHKQHFDTFTNQTVELKVVRPIETDLTIAYTPVQEIHSWRYEVDHSLADQHPHGYQPMLEQILTGVELTEDIISDITRRIISQVELISDRMPWNPSKHDSLPSEFERIVEGLSALNTQHQIEEIYSKFESDEKKIHILHNAMIAAGTEPVVTFILDHIVDSAFRQKYRGDVVEFFNALPKIARYPSYIPKIMELVKQIGWEAEEREIKSVALLSFTSLLNEMCLNYERRSAHWDVTCEHKYICDTDTILNTYLPYMRESLWDEESPTWRRYVYLEALSAMNTPFKFEILRPIIMGSIETLPIFRRNAIWGFRKGSIPDTSMGQVFELLMPIFENIGELDDVRSMAFLTMGTWEVNYGWWQRMARATWNDPSTKVASFISTTITSTAHLHDGSKLSEIASRVEHLIKPAAPVSISRSLTHYLLDLHSNKPVSFGWLANSDSILPHAIHLRLIQMKYLGFTDTLTIGVQQHGVAELIFNLFLEMNLKQHPPNEDALGIVRDMYNEIKEKLDFSAGTNQGNAYLILAYGFDIINLLQVSQSPLLPPFYNRPYFRRDRNAFLAMPTDLGVPFIARNTFDWAVWFEHSFAPGASSTKGSTKFTLEAGYRFYVETKTITPWSNTFAVGTGLEDEGDAVLPFTIHHNANLATKEIQLIFEPITDDKLQLLEAHSHPFTVRHEAFPTLVHRDGDFKLIEKYNQCQYNRRTQVFPSAAGIWMESSWKGDIPSPLHYSDMLKQTFDWSAPSLTYWEESVTYDPEASTTKSVSITGTYVSTDKTTSFGGLNADIEVMGQESQSSSDYADYSQFSQSSSDYSQQFGDADVLAEVQQSASRQRIAQMQEQVVPATGGHVNSISLDFDLQGTENKKYAFLLTWATGYPSTKYITKVQATWIKDVPDGVLDEPHSTCLNMQIVKPLIMPFTSSEDIVNMDFESSFKIDLHDGINCDLPPVVEIDGKMEVSDVKLNEIRKKLNGEEDCHLETVDIVTSPIYDFIKYKVHWTEGLPVFFKNLTYNAYDIVRGLKFPDIFYDYTVNNAEHEMEVEAVKCFETNEWTAHITKPHEVSIMEHVTTPYFFDVIASPAPAKATLVYDIFNAHNHRACVISNDMIHTSDGMEYPYHPDECWNVLAIDTTSHETGVAMSRYHDGELELRLVFNRWGLLLDVTRNSFKVNGEDFRGKDDRFDHYQVADGHIVVIHGFMNSYYKVSDKIYMLEEPIFYGKVGGLCGSNNGEKHADLVGPKGCIYTDPDLFVKSWTAPGEGCSGFGFLSRKKPVEAFQDVCSHQAHVPTGITYPQTAEPDDCTTWHYEERTEGSLKCKALVPTPKCQLNCHAVRGRTVPITYDCQETDQTHYYYPKCFLHKYPTVIDWGCVHN